MPGIDVHCVFSKLHLSPSTLISNGPFNVSLSFAKYETITLPRSLWKVKLVNLCISWLLFGQVLRMSTMIVVDKASVLVEINRVFDRIRNKSFITCFPSKPQMRTENKHSSRLHLDDHFYDFNNQLIYFDVINLIIVW